jgi:hypothetical protein
MLKEGDTVTVGCNPTVKVGEGFLFFKPHASVTRMLSDDMMGDLKDMQAELRKQLFRALQTEIVGVSDIYEALGDGAEMDDLLALCKKEMGDVEAQSTFQVHEGEVAPKVEIDGDGNVVPKSKGGVTKKGPGKHAKAKAGVKKKPKG